MTTTRAKTEYFDAIQVEFERWARASLADPEGGEAGVGAVGIRERTSNDLSNRLRSDPWSVQRWVGARAVCRTLSVTPPRAGRRHTRFYLPEASRRGAGII